MLNANSMKMSFRTSDQAGYDEGVARPEVGDVDPA